MDNTITKTFTVTITVDKDQAMEIKNGKGDWDAYPNWDINYLGDEGEFIDGLIRELQGYGKYSGITVEVRNADV